MNLFEVYASLTLDTSSFIRSLRNAQSGMNDAKKSLSEYRSDVMKLARQYEASGMSMSDAMKKAYSEIDKSLYHLGKDADSNGNKIKSFGEGFKNLHDKISTAKSRLQEIAEKFSLSGDSAKDSSEKVSLFGEVLKANLSSEAIVTGVQNIISGFEKIGAMAVNFMRDSVSVGMDFESSMSQVAATMGLTTQEIENQIVTVGNFTGNLREYAEKLGAETAFSATQAAQGLNILAQAGLSAEEQISGLPTVLDMAAAGGLSLETSASYVTAAIKGFQDDMANAQYYSDLIAKGATLANTSVSALGEAFAGTAATAKSYRQSAESMEISLLRLAEQNVTGSEASTALSRVMMDLFTPTNEAKNAL